MYLLPTDIFKYHNRTRTIFVFSLIDNHNTALYNLRTILIWQTRPFPKTILTSYPFSCFLQIERWIFGRADSSYSWRSRVSRSATRPTTTRRKRSWRLRRHCSTIRKRSPASRAQRGLSCSPTPASRWAKRRARHFVVNYMLDRKDLRNKGIPVSFDFMTFFSMP